MKVKMWLLAIVVGLMGFLSPAWAKQDQSTGTASSLFITFNKVWAKPGTTASALWRSYHARGGEGSLKEFLAVYCTLQQMKICGDADFRKLPVGYWKVPAAPVAYYLKNGKKAPETFAFTLTKKSEGIYTPAMSVSPVQPVVSAVAKSALKSVAAQPAVELPVVPMVVKSTEKIPTITQPETTAAVETPHEVKRHNSLLVPIQTGDTVVAPSSTNRGGYSLTFVIALATFMAGLAVAFLVWVMIRRAQPAPTNDSFWTTSCLQEEKERLEKKSRSRLLNDQVSKKKMIEVLCSSAPKKSTDMEVTVYEMVDRLIKRYHEIVEELSEAKKVTRRFDLPKELMRDDGVAYLYLMRVGEERVLVADNPDPMRFSAVRNHLMNNEQSRRFYGINLERRGESFAEVISLPTHAQPAPC